ncbi:MAG: thioesterase [Proteobacteria bacterium]|nr:MAG: thioesterase [Pseudomonadota bacterium]
MVYTYETKVRVIYGDTDAATVVYHANYLRYLEIGRTEMMREKIASYHEIQKLGIVLPVTECQLRYKAPAFYDDVLIVECHVAKLTRLTCRFNYRILREEGDKRKLLVKGYTVHAAVNKEGKLIKLPRDLYEKIADLIHEEE